jgi:hypothetical protein
VAVTNTVRLPSNTHLQSSLIQLHAARPQRHLKGRLVVDVLAPTLSPEAAACIDETGLVVIIIASLLAVLFGCVI